MTVLDRDSCSWLERGGRGGGRSYSLAFSGTSDRDGLTVRVVSHGNRDFRRRPFLYCWPRAASDASKLHVPQKAIIDGNSTCPPSIWGGTDSLQPPVSTPAKSRKEPQQARTSTYPPSPIGGPRRWSSREIGREQKQPPAQSSAGPFDPHRGRPCACSEGHGRRRGGAEPLPSPSSPASCPLLSSAEAHVSKRLEQLRHDQARGCRGPFLVRAVSVC